MIDMFYARRLFSLDKSNGLRTPLVLLENDAGVICLADLKYPDADLSSRAGHHSRVVEGRRIISNLRKE
jgi:hypothetical protein